MEYLSAKQQEVLERDTRILRSARQMLLSHGYYGMTMDRIATDCDCPKGTMYQRFTCKEDIMVALALECSQRRMDLMRRGASYDGSSRVRMGGVGEAMGLYERLNPDDSTIIHLATGPIREKASAQRAIALRKIEHGIVDFVEGILSDAIAHGELDLPPGASVQEMAFALWSLVDGAYRLIENSTPQQALGIEYPVRELWVVYNRIADA
ncbi:MAG: TetR family transcriptional regulator, partial [Nitrospiraceae bacterium]|nr:TetR family transcriptional regulator [Nitrospiraceae bacterium]